MLMLCLGVGKIDWLVGSWSLVVFYHVTALTAEFVYQALTIKTKYDGRCLQACVSLPGIVKVRVSFRSYIVTPQAVQRGDDLCPSGRSLM